MLLLLLEDTLSCVRTKWHGQCVREVAGAGDCPWPGHTQPIHGVHVEHVDAGVKGSLVAVDDQILQATQENIGGDFAGHGVRFDEVAHILQ